MEGSVTSKKVHDCCCVKRLYLLEELLQALAQLAVHKSSSGGQRLRCIGELAEFLKLDQLLRLLNTREFLVEALQVTKARATSRFNSRPTLPKYQWLLAAPQPLLF